MMQAKKGRRDHYLPQGYLRGFIDPARRDEAQPLWLLDVRSGFQLITTPLYQQQVGRGTLNFFGWATPPPTRSFWRTNL